MLAKQNSIPQHIYNHYRNIVISEVRRAKKKIYYNGTYLRVVGNIKMHGILSIIYCNQARKRTGIVLDR